MIIKNIKVDPRVLLGELAGTFVLVLVAITTGGSAITVGFAMLVLFVVLHKTTGAHVNPAVTFGLWSIKKFETVLVPFYWAAQFIGALLAFVVSSYFMDKSFAISFASFNNLDPKIFMAELIGTAIFVFTVVAATQQGFKTASKALAIGFGLLIGLATGSGLIALSLQSPNLANVKETPRIAKINGITANPAVALASTEKASQSMTAEKKDADTTQPSQLTGEVVLGTLVGAALGANLLMLIINVNPFETDKKKSTKTTVTTKVTTKGKKKSKK